VDLYLNSPTSLHVVRKKYLYLYFAFTSHRQVKHRSLDFKIHDALNSQTTIHTFQNITIRAYVMIHEPLIKAVTSVHRQTDILYSTPTYQTQAMGRKVTGIYFNIKNIKHASTKQLLGPTTRYGLGRSGDRTPEEARFSAPVHTGPWAHPASPIRSVPGLSWGLNGPGVAFFTPPPPAKAGSK
jgi:hypothetical protein